MRVLHVYMGSCGFCNGFCCNRNSEEHVGVLNAWPKGSSLSELASNVCLL